MENESKIYQFFNKHNLLFSLSFSILIFILSLIWFYQSRDFEPLLALITSVIAMLSLVITNNPKILQKVVGVILGIMISMLLLYLIEVGIIPGIGSKHDDKEIATIKTQIEELQGNYIDLHTKIVELEEDKLAPISKSPETSKNIVEKAGFRFENIKCYKSSEIICTFRIKNMGFQSEKLKLEDYNTYIIDQAGNKANINQVELGGIRTSSYSSGIVVPFNLKNGMIGKIQLEPLSNITAISIMKLTFSTDNNFRFDVIFEDIDIRINKTTVK